MQQTEEHEMRMQNALQGPQRLPRRRRGERCAIRQQWVEGHEHVEIDMRGLVNDAIEVKEMRGFLGRIHRRPHEDHTERRKTRCGFGGKRLRHQLHDGNQTGEFVREMRLARGERHLQRLEMTPRRCGYPARNAIGVIEVRIGFVCVNREMTCFGKRRGAMSAHERQRDFIHSLANFEAIRVRHVQTSAQGGTARGDGTHVRLRHALKQSEVVEVQTRRKASRGIQSFDFFAKTGS
ncbi:hypothetical protein QCE63_19730 [Caballeronia sp. LZ065]|nr:hypothetical protein [Caballeronia sp. LZ065]MDR5781634.1 hypothetical protein [Caballeronia sp. LZ065]